MFWLSHWRTVDLLKVANGAKILKLTALRDQTIDVEQFRFGNLPDGKLAELALRHNDILISRGNGSIRLVGKAALVRDIPKDEIAYPDTMIRVRLNQALICPSYFVSVWNSYFVRRQIEKCARTTAGIHKISQRDIEEMTIPAPSLHMQAMVVQELDRQLSICNEQLITISGALKRANQLHRAVLGKAFSGKLVPQDPNDEPASVLLERIRAECAQQATSKPALKPRTRRRKAMAVEA
jgi:type I restriction enzyme, S subunit